MRGRLWYKDEGKGDKVVGVFVFSPSPYRFIYCEQYYIIIIIIYKKQ